eukprot:1754757-Prymnesium_polylepis.1
MTAETAGSFTGALEMALLELEKVSSGRQSSWRDGHAEVRGYLGADARAAETHRGPESDIVPRT